MSGLETEDMSIESTDDGSMATWLSQLPTILWQRKWLIIFPIVLSLSAALAALFLLPKKYESSATLLVQAPSLPTEIIGLQADEAVQQRIESIRQRLLNRPELISMIERNDLYIQDRMNKPLSAIIETMREAITLDSQTIELNSFNRRERTITVRLAYVYEDPVAAQAVTQQLMERVLEFNATTSAEQATETVQFLRDQEQELQRRIEEAEAELAAFNRQYGRVISSASVATIGGSGTAYDLQISNLRREVADLEAQKRLLESADTRDPAVVQAEAQLASARARYSESHPDVVLARQNLEEAKNFARQNVSRVPTEEIDNRLRMARNQIAQLEVAKAQESAQTSALIARRSQLPVVEQQAIQFQQRLTTLNKQYEQVSDQLLAAQASERAGQEQMGERLLVVDPPVVPDTPISPNRPLILAIGLLGGVALGFMLALAVEILLHPIRDPAKLAKITGSHPLAIIPLLPAKNKKQARNWFKLWRRNRWT